MNTELLEGLWYTSLVFAVASLLVMSGLILSRMLGSYGDRKRDLIRKEMINIFYALMDEEAIDRERLWQLLQHSRTGAQAILEFSTLIRGEALKAVVDRLAETGFEENLLRLSRSANAAARLAAIDALGYLGAEAATRRLARIANHGRGVEDRIAAVRALQLRGDAIDIEAVVNALRLIGDHLPGEFEAVLDGLARTSPQSVEDILDTRGLPTIAYAQAVRSLGESGNYASLPKLMEMVGSNNVAVRTAALGALGRLGHPAAEPVIAKGLVDTNEDVRASAARAAGEIGLSSVWPQLVRLLDDAGWDVRINAARALSRLGHDGMAALRQVAASGTTARPARTAQMLLAEMGVSE